MNMLAQYALLGAIVAAALGALLVCVLAYAYGFTTPEAQPVVERRRRRITRLGHVLAAGAFGAAGLLAVTGVIAAMASTPAAPQLRTLQDRVSGMASTLHDMADAANRVRARVRGLREPPDRLAAATPGSGAGASPGLPERKPPERAGYGGASAGGAGKQTPEEPALAVWFYPAPPGRDPVPASRDVWDPSWPDLPGRRDGPAAAPESSPPSPPAGGYPGSRPAPAGAVGPRPPEPIQEATAPRHLELTRIERLEQLERVGGGEPSGRPGGLESPPRPAVRAMPEHREPREPSGEPLDGPDGGDGGHRAGRPGPPEGRGRDGHREPHPPIERRDDRSR